MIRLGDFSKLLATKIQTKVAQMICNFLGNVEKPHSYVKTAADIFGLLLETFGLLFTTTSGHTVCDRLKLKTVIWSKNWPNSRDLAILGFIRTRRARLDVQMRRSTA